MLRAPEKCFKDAFNAFNKKYCSNKE